MFISVVAYVGIRCFIFFIVSGVVCLGLVYTVSWYVW